MNDSVRNVQEQLLVPYAPVLYRRPEIDTFNIRHQKALNKPCLSDNSLQQRYSSNAFQCLVIVHLSLEAVLTAFLSHEFVHKFRSLKRYDDDVGFQFLDMDQVFVVHGREIAVEMRS